MKYFLFILLFVTVVRIFFFYNNAPQIKDGEKLTFSATLLSESKQVGKYQQISLVLANGTRISIKTLLFPKYHYGQTIVVEGKVQENSSSSTSFLLGFKSIAMTMFFPKIEARKSDQNSALALLFVIRQKIIFLFQNALPQHQASLLLGIVFGIKGDFPKDYYEKLQQAGVLHIIAASGMNVTMVAAFLSALFGKFLKRQYGLVLTIVGIFIYGVFSGMEPSIVRASIMGTLVFTSQIFGRQRLSWYLLLLTGSSMLLFYPYLLLDVGFQLSFMATAGILGFSAFFKKFVSKILPAFIAEDVITTLGAQLTTVPLLLAHFGSYSLVSILANTLVLWEIPFLMIIGGAGAIFGIVFPFLGKLMLYLSIPLLTYFDFVINSISRLPGLLAFGSLPITIIIGYYFVLAAVWMVLVKREV